MFYRTTNGKLSHEPKYFLELALQKLFIAYLLCAEPALEAGDVPWSKACFEERKDGTAGLRATPSTWGTELENGS